MTDSLSAMQKRNAETVRLMYECERRGDLETWVSLWHPDGKQTFPWGAGNTEVVGIAALRASTAHKFAARAKVEIRDEVYPMADAQWVFATADVSIHFRELGRALKTQLWCRFHFNDQGRILEQQEVFDTSLMKSFFAI